MENINYSKISLNLLKKLSPRAREVIERRFGLSKERKGETLEAIGKDYNITRERVRQIERESISLIKKQNLKELFEHINNVLVGFGGVKREDLLISSLGKEKNRNEIFFFLVLNNNLKRVLEDKNFHTFWAIGEKISDQYLKTTDKAISFFKKNKKSLFIEELYNQVNIKNITLPVFQSHIEISKQIQKNLEGKIGLKNWMEINPKGVRDKAYLVLRKAEKPLHFSEIATLIKNSTSFFTESVHTATVHNELIKNEKFVLVGRGLYALKEWGYEPGVVKDIILKVLAEVKRPLSREEILEKVLKKRMVKEHTILLNLQDRNKFLKDEEGKYMTKDVKEG